MGFTACDDHVKNIAYLMDRKGRWQLSPVFDVAYSYNPSGDWTQQHQMSVNGKRNDFFVDDLIHYATTSGLKATKGKQILSAFSAAIDAWLSFAAQADLPHSTIQKLSRSHRRKLFV